MGADATAHAGHRVVADWMGRPVETLADLLRPGLRAVCVGINPSLVSVAAGHYYQGRLGKRFFARMRRAGLLPAGHEGAEDDALFARGIGFTDIVKRPTPRATGLRADEFRHGLPLLTARITEARPALLLFTYKRTADAVLGARTGRGLLPGCGPGGVDCFVMPGPYAPAAEVERGLAELAAVLGVTGG